MTLTPDEVTNLIKKNLPDAKIDITDLKGDNNHYHAKIVGTVITHCFLLNLYFPRLHHLCC